MRNYFTVKGYAVNKRGLTVGIAYQFISSSVAAATAHAMLLAQNAGLTHVRISRIHGVAA
ncbi:hypothetical protein KC222_11945 [Cedecea davisae]|uniref:Uncharacterized protein n=1 Tax=Cedecea davisae TaxID=158484 RepID=A0ABS6DJ50_9ENTR|nr:hypothetical protein [Cedecea davisae]MBU4682725.1 hypothetical protein [Cedecea davisae]MBU4686285.1 hypothetical protein [Cedecea davisae]